MQSKYNDNKDIYVPTKSHTDLSNQIDHELTILKKYYPASQKEKFSKSSVIFFINEAKTRESNKSLGEKAWKRIATYTRTQLQKHYGPYANILIDKRGNISYNIDQIYKTPFGTLYASNGIKHILITTHALDRFEQRISQQTQQAFKKYFLLKYKFATSTLETVVYYIMHPKSYFIDKNGDYFLLCFLNPPLHIIGHVICVLQKIETIFIVKTILPQENVKNYPWINRDDNFNHRQIHLWLLSLK